VKSIGELTPGVHEYYTKSNNGLFNEEVIFFIEDGRQGIWFRGAEKLYKIERDS